MSWPGGVSSWSVASSVDPVVDLSAVVGLEGWLLTAAVVAAVLGTGVVLVWRFESGLYRSADAAMERPLASIVYGVAVHLVIAFVGLYLTLRLGEVDWFGYRYAELGVVTGLGLLLVTATVGFTVVGMAVVAMFDGPDVRRGLVLGAGIAGGLTLLDPRVGMPLWLVVVSAGIGGYARRWATASYGPDPA